jgi:hypothetical protein
MVQLDTTLTIKYIILNGKILEHSNIAQMSVISETEQKVIVCASEMRTARRLLSVLKRAWQNQLRLQH